MTDAELVNLARDSSNDIAGAFGQIVTITFAMVVGIFYFLNQARLGLRVFAYLVYGIGMFLYFGLMLVASNVHLGALEGLAAIPEAQRSRPAAYLLAIRESWIAHAESALLTGAFWILLIGVGYLLFVWKKADHLPPGAS